MPVGIQPNFISTYIKIIEKCPDNYNDIEVNPRS